MRNESQRVSDLLHLLEDYPEALRLQLCDPNLTEIKFEESNRNINIRNVSNDSICMLLNIPSGSDDESKKHLDFNINYMKNFAFEIAIGLTMARGIAASIHQILCVQELQSVICYMEIVFKEFFTVYVAGEFVENGKFSQGTYTTHPNAGLVCMLLLLKGFFKIQRSVADREKGMLGNTRTHSDYISTIRDCFYLVKANQNLRVVTTDKSDAGQIEYFSFRQKHAILKHTVHKANYTDSKEKFPQEVYKTIFTLVTPALRNTSEVALKIVIRRLIWCGQESGNLRVKIPAPQRQLIVDATRKVINSQNLDIDIGIHLQQSNKELPTSYEAEEIQEFLIESDEKSYSATFQRFAQEEVEDVDKTGNYSYEEDTDDGEMDSFYREEMEDE